MPPAAAEAAAAAAAAAAAQIPAEAGEAATAVLGSGNAQLRVPARQALALVCSLEWYLHDRQSMMQGTGLQPWSDDVACIEAKSKAHTTMLGTCDGVDMFHGVQISAEAAAFEA